MTGWEAATFKGAEREREHRIARATPAERLAWLEEALRLAAVSGALQRARSERQAACDREWAGSS